MVGLAASRVGPDQRGKAIFWGIAGAVLLRLMFAGFITQIFSIVGLTLAGGLLLLWACWKMYRDLRGRHVGFHAGKEPPGPPMSLSRAVVQMVVADVSMSLDNVLAVAGAARDSILVLIVGLTVSVSLMAVASNLVVRLLGRFPWIAWLGLAIVVAVALDMVWRGLHELEPRLLR